MREIVKVDDKGKLKLPKEWIKKDLESDLDDWEAVKEELLMKSKKYKKYFG